MIIACVLGLVLLRVFYLVGEMFYERDWPRATWRGLVTALALMFICASAFGQTAGRVDIPLLTAGPYVPLSGGPLPQALWVSDSQAFLCAHPSSLPNTVSDTLSDCQANPIVTFTDSTEATPCPANAQLVQLPGNICTVSTGVTSNIGAWTTTFPFDYWLVSPYGTYGPYTYSAPASSSGAGCSVVNGCTFQAPVSLSSDLPTGHQAASANAAVTTVSVLAYGGKADWHTGQTVTIVNGTNNFTVGSWGTNPPATIGQYVFFTGYGTAPFAGGPPYVAKVTGVSGNTFTTDHAYTPGSNESATITWGTDTAAALNAAELAAATAGGGIVAVPAGAYFLATSPYYMLTGAFDDGAYQQPAGGTGATGTCTLGTGATAGQVVSCAVTNGGSGYTINSTLQVAWNGVTGCVGVTPCSGFWATATTNGLGAVAAINVYSAGFGFTNPPTITITPLGGDLASATVTIAAGAINGTTINTAGSGYPASSSTIHVWGYGVPGTIGCASILNISGLGTISGMAVVAQGTAQADASGHITGITWGNPGSGCTSPPSVVFGDALCASSGTVSGFDSQCTNVAPLMPYKQPVQVWSQPNVSIKGETGMSAAGVSLNGIWENTVNNVNNNPTAMIGPNIVREDYSGLTLNNCFTGIFSFQFTSYFHLYNMAFNCTIGMQTWAYDLNSVMDNVSFGGYGGWINGGSWRSRGTFPAGQGGEMNGLSISNINVRLVPHTAVSDAIDDWFNNNWWHAEYSAIQSDFPEVCRFPQAANQRQTSHNFTIAQQVNYFCYPGATGSGFVNLSRDNRGGESVAVTNFLTKGLFRYIWYGYAGVDYINTISGAEQGVMLVTDNYRPGPNAAQQEGAIVMEDAGATFLSPNWGLQTGQTTRLLWSILQDGASSPGLPTNTAWYSANCLSCANVDNTTNPNFPTTTTFGKNVIDFPSGATAGAASRNGNTGFFAVEGRSGGTVNNPGTYWQWDGACGGNGGSSIYANDHTTVLQRLCNTTSFFTAPKICNPASTGNCATFNFAGTGARAVAFPDAASNTVQGAASATAGSVVQYTGTDGVQHYIATPAAIANGTSALGTGAITTLTCATVVTTAASGVLATDTISWAFNAAPGSGWPGLTIQPYPTANNVNFLVCNPTAGSVTPAAATLNWRVGR